MSTILAAWNGAAAVWWEWMVPMSLQVTALALLVLVLDRLLSRSVWPQVRLVLWLLVMAKLVLPPTVASPLSVWQLVPLSVPAATGASSVTAEAASPAIGATGATLTATSVLFLLWAAGVLLCGSMLFGRYRSTRRRLAALPEVPAPEWLRDVLSMAVARVGLRRMPAVRIIPGGSTGPLVFGLVRPTILIPESLVGTRSRRELEHVLLHELAHVKRHDLVLTALGAALHVVYWFHPCVLLARRRLAHLGELCCDATVAGWLRESTSEYRRTLLAIGASVLLDSRPAAFPQLGLIVRHSQLLHRLELLRRPVWRHAALRRVLTGCVAVIALFCALPSSRAMDRGRPPAEAVEPEAHSVVGTARTPELAVEPGTRGCLALRYQVMQMMARQQDALGPGAERAPD